MAKRFTDTDKFKDPWFRKLNPKLKILFYFMCDDCNHAGIWKENFDTFEHYFNIKITHEDMSGFGDKVVRIDEETYFIKNFISFQYGELRDNNAAHFGVIKALKANNIEYEVQSGYSNSPSAIMHRLSNKKKKELMAKDYFNCTYCGFKGDEHTLVIDHIVPRSKGGENQDYNLTTSCVSCNSKKSDLDVEVFIHRHQLQQQLSEKLRSKLDLIKSLNGAIKSLNGAKDMDMDMDNISIILNNNTVSNNTVQKEISVDSEIDLPIPKPLHATLKSLHGYPDEVIEHFRKQGLILFHGSSDPGKNWSRWIANYFKNNTTQIKNYLLEQSSSEPSEAYEAFLKQPVLSIEETFGV